MSRRRQDGALLAAAAVLALSAGAALVLAGGASGAARTVLAGLFLLLAPGLAVTGQLGLRDPLAGLQLAVAASLTIDLLVAETLVLLDAWSVDAALAALVALSVAGAAVPLARAALTGGRTASRGPRRSAA